MTSAMEFFCRPSVHLHHIFFLLQKNFSSTAQISSSFHSQMLCWRSSFHCPAKLSARTRTYRQPPEMSLGLEIMREHSHLAEPDIRHILFSTRSLPHFTTCLHSNPRQQDWIQLKAGHQTLLEEGHRTISRLDPMHTIAKAILSIIAKESFDVK